MTPPATRGMRVHSRARRAPQAPALLQVNPGEPGQLVAPERAELITRLKRERDQASLRDWGELSTLIEEAMGGRPPTRPTGDAPHRPR
jgi:hypothetical protein